MVEIEEYQWAKQVLDKAFPYVNNLRLMDYSEELTIFVGYKDRHDEKWVKRYPIWLISSEFDCNSEPNPEYWLQVIIKYIHLDYKTRYCWK